MATSQTASEKGLFQLSNSDRFYTEVSLNSWLQNITNNGLLLRGETLTTQLKCEASSGTMNTVFNKGVATIEGHQLIFTSTETATPLIHTTADVTNARIDLIVVEKNTDAGTRADSIKIVTGTPAGTPVAPTLTQSTTIWQEKLYEVLIPANETDADNFTYTDYREIAYSNIDIADDSITESKIADDAVTEDKILDDAVTPDKIERTPMCELYLTSDVTSDGDILWTGEQSDDFGMHASSSKYVVVPNAGDWLISFTGYVTTSTTILPTVEIEIYNSSDVLQRTYYVRKDAQGFTFTIDRVVVPNLNSGDKILVTTTIGLTASIKLTSGLGYTGLVVKYQP